jgi:hypothetical protein
MNTFVKEFENYILSDGGIDTLSTVVSGSQADLYIQVVNKLKDLEKDKKALPDVWSLLNKHKDKLNTGLYDYSKLVVMLKEYDIDTTTKERKDEILEQIKTSFFANYHYNYSKPSHIQKSHTSTDDSRLKDTLDENVLTLKATLDKWYSKTATNTGNLPGFKEGTFLQNIDIMSLNDQVFLNVIQNHYTNFPYHELSNDAIARFANLINSSCDKDKCLSINVDYVLAGLTCRQIELLMVTIISSYFDKNILINSYINKKYGSKLSAARDDYERRDVLLQIYEYINKHGNLAGYKANLLLQILENGMKINQYDRVLFKEYLKNPVSGNIEIYLLKEAQVKSIKKQQRWNICGTDYVTSDNAIIKAYLRHFFLFDHDVTIKTFEENIKYDFLLRCYYEAMIQKGEETSDMVEFIGQTTYEQIVKKTEITICNHNKPVFGVSEPIVLDVDIKNIQTLFVKIFEINTENYYYNKKVPINTAMSLEGLITTYEETYSFNEKPQKVIRRKIELEKIPQRRGLWIIEMIGGGYSSRAIIKKGGLSLITGPAPRGKVVFIADELHDVCNTKSTGLWFKDTFYTPDPNTGGIMIPYMRQTYSENCILVHEGFAELANLEITDENYSLTGFFHFNHESLMMGNTAKIFVKPYLTINGREAKLENLKNAKVTVLLTKIENELNIPISNVYDKLVVNNEKEIDFEIQIPPKLTAIDFLFEAEIYNYSKEVKETLSFRQNILLNSLNEDSDIIRQYLRKKVDHYVITVLGKNGEPKADQVLNIQFTHKILNNIINVTLQTNDHGEVNLGSLDYVESLMSTTQYLSRSIDNSWEIPREREFSYPTNIDILNTDTIALPYDDVKLERKHISFVKKNNSTLETIYDCFEHVKLVSAGEGSNRFNINIFGLNEGFFILTLKKSNTTIYINVHNGKSWKTNNFIILKDKIIENSEYKYPIQLSNFKFENTKLTIKVSSHCSNPRVNIFLYQFLHFKSGSAMKNHNSNCQHFQMTSTHYFQNWKNFYLSNRLLNEEIQYVFDRKYFERFIGNSLERPSLLMKRQYVRDTTTDFEQVAVGTEYDKKEADVIKTAESMSRSKVCKRKMDKSGGSWGKSGQSLYSNFHNFLAYSPAMLLNLIPNEHGEIVIDNINLNEYSHVHIIAIDEKSITEENHSLVSFIMSKRSLTLHEPLDVEKTYSELRITELIGNDMVVNISDITSTKFKLLDSLEKYVNFAGLVNSNLNSNWNTYSFLLKLNELSEDEQKKKLSNLFSHEINLFIYFKYPQLFEKYVKPVLKYKAEKTFVDFFLMNDLPSLIKFCSSQRLESLNAFEKCLLIYAVRKENPEIAEKIYNCILTNSESTKVSVEELKRLFNILMNMKVQEPEIKPHHEQVSGISNMDTRPGVPSMARALAMGIPGAASFSRSIQMEESCDKKVMKKQCKKEEKRRESVRAESGSDGEEDEDDIFDSAQRNVDENEIYRKNAMNNLFKEAGKSKEFCETHWRILNFQKNNIPDNLFWTDLAKYWLDNKEITLATDFLSKNILFKINNISELLCILAVLDLPSQPANHQFNRKDGRSLEIKAKSNLIIFTKEIAETDSKINSNLMIAQSLSELNQSNPETVISEYIVNKIYVHETIVTNISSQNITFELLVQIPEGAMPVMGSEYTKTINQSLSRFNTTSYKTYFYFTEPGSFRQYPPNIAVDGVVISKAQMLVYDVVKSATIQSKENLDNVLEMGSKSDILEFISSQKIIKHNELSKVFWLLKEKDFYLSLIDILRKRGLFNITVWVFGFYHKDESAIRELVTENKQIRKILGPSFVSGLLTVDETNNFDIMNHFDYHPIINARVHRLGQENKLTILNREMKQTYQEFILYLICQPEINSKNWLRFTYYLILQDKIEEALKAFRKVKVGEFSQHYSLQIQYDYIAAYLDFSTGYPDFKVAKEICRKYKEFPLTQ